MLGGSRKADPLDSSPSRQLDCIVPDFFKPMESEPAIASIELPDSAEILFMCPYVLACCRLIYELNSIFRLIMMAGIEDATSSTGTMQLSTNVPHVEDEAMDEQTGPAAITVSPALIRGVGDICTEFGRLGWSSCLMPLIFIRQRCELLE